MRKMAHVIEGLSLAGLLMRLAEKFDEIANDTNARLPNADSEDFRLLWKY